ncbi:hypothetical protein HN014_05035 [Aquimarina sp. TRL1]|uniref:hypothetical protein n=1 Tax=Aquimarina sp. (strain TRL1) TaxID=2736252 RepID=UPI00158C7A49|nr:hypothetical protein [Aquimarina sp. TRL1]QKX04300.1 hypothetical protein HN014_05035 [Aquimarina sp. TRL1]
MKNLKVVLIAIFVVSFQAFSADKSTKSPEQQLRNEIINLLDNPDIKISNNEVKANIEFTLNSKNEIVILTVNSETESLENFVKYKLNYKKVNSKMPETNSKIFRMSLKVLNPNV